ncbi:Hpt domain-containing protein [Magnetospirillum sp. SS-4]|uniref:Hpt domain-containing protein n=1 Tax=Magnetospirillum sp. SS-4 TaxID=2681465 RepID=UPI001382D238|nr:Hpt domain-containing protein [Magnetospirillum sp. SS-4]CAA7626299.1 conserved hypothetical protein [Magnetospirillum sp. SS-4]
MSPPPADHIPVLDPAALARAEAALADLSGRYLEWAEADLVRMEACLREIMDRPEDRPELLGRLFAVAHDMKGQGATFDYPLVSHLGNRLCRLVEGSPSPSPESLDRIARLVAALGKVVRGRLSGDGGDEGRRLLAEET